MAKTNRMNSKEEEKYIPGTCNIGNEQLAKRKRFALKSVLATILCVAFLQAFHLDKIWRLAMFFPFALTTIGIQQVYFKFCYVFGIKGYYGFGELKKTRTVQEDEFKKSDKAKAMRMIVTSVLIGLFLTILYYYLPV